MAITFQVVAGIVRLPAHVAAVESTFASYTAADHRRFACDTNLLLIEIERLPMRLALLMACEVVRFRANVPRGIDLDKFRRQKLVELANVTSDKSLAAMSFWDVNVYFCF